MIALTSASRLNSISCEPRPPTRITRTPAHACTTCSRLPPGRSRKCRSHAFRVSVSPNRSIPVTQNPARPADCAAERTEAPTRTMRFSLAQQAVGLSFDSAGGCIVGVVCYFLQNKVRPKPLWLCDMWGDSNLTLASWPYHHADASEVLSGRASPKSPSIGRLPHAILRW